MNAFKKQSVFKSVRYTANQASSLGGVLQTSSLPMLACLMTLVISLCTAARTQAQSLTAAGDGKDMWIVLPEADKGLTILHRKADDVPQHFWKVTTLPGLLTPGGAAAGQQQLWLIYNTMMVQSMHLVSDPAMPQARYSQAQFLTSLPDDVTIRSLAGSSTSLWALLDVKTPAALHALEQPDITISGQDDTVADELPVDDNTGKTTSNAVTGIDAAASVTKSDKPQTQPTEPKAFETPVPRLAKLSRGPWETIALPNDWPTGQRAWIITTQLDDAYPTLVVEPQGQDASHLRVYRHDGKSWQATDHTTPGDTDEIAFLTVQNQLVMAAKSANEEKMRVTLWALRSERKEVIQIGQLGFDAPATSNWGVAPDGLSAALFMQTGAKPPQSTAMNLMGQITQTPAPIQIEQPAQFVQNPGQMLLVGVVAISIFLMFVIWRRDPNLDDVTLPKDRVLADFGRRIGAAAIDLAPCIFIAMLATGVDLSKLQHDWPGRSASWLAMVPGFITIGLFILHTGLSEMFTGKTLGKAICGIEVISTTGNPPNIWQVLARNGLKVFDLIAFYILPVLALVGKHRQRLGDLVGKTVVVMPLPSEIAKQKKNGSASDADSDQDVSDDATDDSSDDLPPRV